jgi:hypothetical protein
MRQTLGFALLGCILGGLPLGAQPTLAGCPMFPANNIWNAPVDKLPVHSNSASYITTNGETKSLHPDFSSTWGIPFNVVTASQPGVKVPFTWAEESDPGPYPVPADPKVEGNGDAHLLILQQDTCRLFELYAARVSGGSLTKADAGAVFDLRSNAQRPSGWTSADGAGLPILPGLVRYDEVAAGEIRHAIRLTVPQTRKAFVWPARHYASRLTGSDYPPMGQRFRLKADYDISGFSADSQVILRALKKYGLILADNGSAWFISGAPDPRWNDDHLNELKRVTGTDLEAVDSSSLMLGQDTGLVLPQSVPPSNVVAYSATPVFDLSAGLIQTLTLAGDVTGAEISNTYDGQTTTFLICQDEVGGHLFLWPSNVRGGMQIGTAPSKCSAQAFLLKGSILYATTPGVPDQ